MSDKHSTGNFPFPPGTNKKSQKLTPEERRALKKFIKGFETMEAAANALTIGRTTLININNIGSGSPENINKIREALNVIA